nr:hypothetical protein [Tanacetum cinerariifolium]
MPQKEETFQVVIDLIKNSSCFKAFTISAYLSKIFMQQLWYSVKNIQGTDSYEFLLDNKKCMFNADVYKTILDPCLRVEGVNFTDVPDDDTTLAFLIKMGYKGEDYQEYGLSITKTMLTEAIKQSKSYQMLIKYTTGQIPPKKSRGKGKSISKTKAEEAEAARQEHATHARIVKESVPEPTKRRKSYKVIFDPFKKLKGVPSLTLDEQEATDIMQALIESKKTSKRQPGTRGSSEGTSTILRVPNVSTVVSATSSDETDDIYKYKIYVCKDEDEEMINAEIKDSDKGDEEDTDAVKADAEKTSEVKNDAKKTELPPTHSSLSIFLDNYLESKVGDVFQKEIKKHSSDLIKKYYLPQIPELPKKPTPTVDLEQESKKTSLEILKIKKEQAEKQNMPKFTIKSTDKADL